MALSIKSILANIKQVSMSPSSMEVLREFERVIDENGLYAFHNWKTLELVEGPIMTAYRVKCLFSSPLTKMPDPAGGARLIPYGAKISYKKIWLKYPIKIKSEDDFRSKIKKAKLAKTPVWLISISLPKYLIKDISKGSEEILDSEIDMDDIDSAYSDDLNTHKGAQDATQEQTDEAE